jgi:hypothetical protein
MRWARMCAPRSRSFPPPSPSRAMRDHDRRAACQLLVFPQTTALVFPHPPRCPTGDHKGCRAVVGRQG